MACLRVGQSVIRYAIYWETKLGTADEQLQTAHHKHQKEKLVTKLDKENRQLKQMFTKKSGLQQPIKLLSLSILVVQE